MVGYNTAPTVVAASDNVAINSPGTYSDGTDIHDTYIQPGWGVGYGINGDHSMLWNSGVFRATTCASFGLQRSRQNVTITYGGVWDHFQAYDCVTDITATGANLDTNGVFYKMKMAHEFNTSGPWANATVINTAGASLRLDLDFNSVQTGVGSAWVATPFGSGQGILSKVTNQDATVYAMADSNRSPSIPAYTADSTKGPLPYAVTDFQAFGPVSMQGCDATTCAGHSWFLGFTLPNNSSVGNDPEFGYYTGSAWAKAWHVSSTDGNFNVDIDLKDPSQAAASGNNCLQIDTAGKITKTGSACVTSSSINLKTNGVNNGSQSLLNLKQGTGMTIADDGVGGITFNCSSCTGGSAYPTAQTVNASASSAVQFTSSCFNASYDRYDFTITGLTPSVDGASISIRYSTDGGSTWISSSNYDWVGSFSFNSSSGNQSGTNSGTSITLGTSTSTATKSMSGLVTLIGANSATAWKALNFDTTAYQSTGAASQVKITGAGHFQTTSAVNGVEFISSSGTLTGPITCQPLPH
jgi:hypothetical protein